MADFHLIEANLRESFRALARGRDHAVLTETRGVSVASLGVAFQMFNAAFLNSPVPTEKELEARIDGMRAQFAARRSHWSFWVCEDWLPPGVQRRLSRLCEKRRLRLSAEMPGMIAGHLAQPSRVLPVLEYRRVDCESTLQDFRAIGALCFHVPPEWFSEVFDLRVTHSDCSFVPWVAYRDGLPVATAATVAAEGSIGLYNIATATAHRNRGYAEAITRHACAVAGAKSPLPFALESTMQGFRMYERMGFRPVTRILVYNSY